MNLHILKYNNYYNRIVKQEASLAAYLSFQVGLTYTNINFIPNDGVDTEQIINIAPNFLGDYLIAEEGSIIDSRWFIIESTRLTSGQYRLILRRDIIVDFYNSILNAPMFIEKATLSQDDPMIFNSENMSFNQIKTKEIQLTDRTKSPYIVGYISRNATATGENKISIAYNGKVDETLENISNYEYYAYSNLTAENVRKTFQTSFTKNYIIFYFRAQNYSADNRVYWMQLLSNESFTGDLQSVISQMIPGGVESVEKIPNGNNMAFVRLSNTYLNQEYFFNLEGGLAISSNSKVYEYINQGTGFINNQPYYEYGINYSTIYEGMKNALELKSNTQLTDLLKENGKLIKDSTSNKIYRVTIAETEADGSVGPMPFENVRQTQVANLTNFMSENASYFSQETYPTPSSPAFNGNLRVEYKTKRYTVTMSEVSNENAVLEITSDREHLQDAPYDMFVIPYDGVKVNKSGQLIYVAEKDWSLSVAQAISASWSQNYLYDIQLLPYCPIIDYITETGELDYGEDKVTEIKDTSGRIISVLLWAHKSSDTFDIPLDDPIVITDAKVQNECDLYRLVSPNYNGQFEFNPAKNGGVTRFNVDFTYLPFSPYIHINPDFGRLYGRDFNDSRGLILGGDFSLPQSSNAFENYKVNNKNYINIFDRQIENLEVNNAIQREREIWGAAGGAISGITSGATAGAMIGGGPVGAVVGGLIGSAASTIAGVKDVQMSDRLRNEAIDYTKDQFGYQLGNIKAMPNSLAKNTAYTFNNKIFPFLEFYTCTDEERQALRDKIKYNGMTVMRIGTIAQFIQQERSYIKGQLIRIDLHEDTHLINQIASELNKGVFI